MRDNIFGIVLLTAFASVVFSGCGSGKSTGGRTTPTPTPTPGATATPSPTSSPTPTASPSPTPSPTPIAITVTFAYGPAPVAVAEQIDGGNWAVASTHGGILSVSLPFGTTKYAVAYVCPTISGSAYERVIEATVSDGTVYSVGCLGGSPSLGHVTGSVDSTAVAGAGATKVAIYGRQGISGNAGSFSEPVSFDAQVPTGTSDIAVMAYTPSNALLGMKILRSQTVPGAIGAITLATSDAATTQSTSVTNVPSGFAAPFVLVNYTTANGTFFPVSISPTSYAAVSTSETESGDFYSYNLTASDKATGKSFIEIVKNTTSGGGPVTFQCPPAWPYSGPAPAAFPTFDFNYSGLPVNAATGEVAEITWTPQGSSTTEDLAVIATGAYQNGATVLTIPDLTALPGFITAPNGVSVSWTAYIYSSTQQFYAFFNLGNSVLPSDSSITLVANQGTYAWPPPP